MSRCGEGRSDAMSQFASLHANCPMGENCAPHDAAMHNLWHEGDYPAYEEALGDLLTMCPPCPYANIQLVACLAVQERFEEADAAVEMLLPKANGHTQLATLCSHKGWLLMQCAGLRQALPWL